MSFQISLCHRSKIIVNQTEWKSSLKEGEGGGLVVLNSSSLLENKKLRKNTGRTAEYMQEWERK